MNTFVPVELRPLSVGQVLDRAIRLFQSNFKSCVAIAAVIELPIGLGWIGYDWLIRSDTRLPFDQEYVVLFWLALTVLLRMISHAALAWGVVQFFTIGRMSVAAAYRQLVSRWWALLQTLFVIVLGGVVVIGWYFIPCIGSLTGVGISLFYFAVLVPFAIPVMMVERVKGFTALRRVWELSRQKFWLLLGYAFLLLMFLFLALTGPRLLLRYGAHLVATGFDLGMPFFDTALQVFQPSLAVSIFLHLVDVAVNVLTWPALMLAVTLFYLDLRVRQEGLDLHLAAAALLPQAPQAADVLAQRPPYAERSLIRSAELGRFMGLTILLVGVPLILGYCLTLIIVALEY